MLQNNRNIRRSKGGSSQYKGVYFHKRKQKYEAVIGVNYRQRYIGTFDTEVEAAKAYNEAAKKLYGDFAGLNPI